MALQNFKAKVGPAVSAAWLNAVDVLKETIFGAAITKQAARTALTSDAPLEVENGGTGVRSYADLSAALGSITVLGGFTAELPNAPSGGMLDVGAVAASVQGITGSGATIVSFGTAASLEAPIYILRFAGAHTLQHSAALILPGAANIITAAGDFLIAEYMSTGAWRVAFYQIAALAPGASVAGPGSIQNLPAYLRDASASADQKNWGWKIVGDGIISFDTLTDAYGTGTYAIKITRSGTTVTRIDLQATDITIGGVTYEIRNWISKNLSLNIPPSYAKGTGTYHPLAGGAGDVYTIVDADFPLDGTTLHFANHDSNSVSIVCSGAVMTLVNTTNTGTRTLAQNGRAWAEKIGGRWLIYGYGLT